METVGEISEKTSLDIDTDNSNRYCIRLQTKTGKEAYYFSTPIYNESSRKLIRMKFTGSNGCFCSVGSNTTVCVHSTHIELVSREKRVLLRTIKPFSFQLIEGVLSSDSVCIYPTFNGVQMFGNIDNLKLEVSSNFDYQDLRTSYNCVCMMESKFRPILVFSSLYSKAQNNIQPLGVQFVKKSSKAGTVSVSSDNPMCYQGAIEINFYESKLFQDTPVSAKRPDENNAFGPIAFIGNTATFGTQWLYCRIDFDKMPELSQNMIGQVKVFFPKIGMGNPPLETYGLPNRFCSFGSKWNNKVPPLNIPEKAYVYKKYLCVDLTKLYVQRGQLSTSPGFVLTPQKNVCGNQIIATGDCYSAPPILYVSYKK